MTRSLCLAILLAAWGCSDGGLPPGAMPVPQAQSSCPAAAVNQQPGPAVLLASGPFHATSLALDTSAIYWTHSGSYHSVSLENQVPNPDGSLMSAPKAGGAAVTLLSGQRAPAYLATNGTRLYFTNADGEVLSLDTQGGAPSVLASGALAYALALDAARLYWATRDAVMALPLSGTTPVTLATGAGWPISLQLDDSSVLWSTHEDSVRRVAKSGGTVDTILSNQGTPTWMALCGTRLYFSESFPRPALAVAGSDGSTPTMLAPGANLWSIAADQGGVYAAMVDQHVQRWPATGGLPVQIAQGGAQSQLGPIAVDDTHVYWAITNGSTGEIWRAAK